VSAELATAAFQRFVEALNQPRDGGALRRAVSDDVELDRHGPGTRDAPGPVAESFAGVAAVERWFARTPAIVRFSLAGAPRLTGDRWSIDYAIDAGEFHNGGTWRAILTADGKIASLQHQPFALADAG
jgi:hypothetical protein